MCSSSSYETLFLSRFQCIWWLLALVTHCTNEVPLLLQHIVDLKVKQKVKIVQNSGSIIDMLSFVWSWPKGQAWTFMCANFQKGKGRQGRWLQLGHFFDQFGSHSKWSSREQHEWIFIVTPLKKNRSVPSSCCILHTYTHVLTNESKFWMKFAYSMRSTSPNQNLSM